MKNSIICAAAAAAALFGAVSCNKNLDSKISSPWEVQDGKDYHLITLKVGSPQTKSLSAAAEDAVSDIQIFVFNNDNNIENYYKGTDQTVTMKLTTGFKRVRVLVNASDYGSSAATLSDLEAKVAQFSENTAEHLVMVGEDSLTVSKAWTLPITVHRIAAKVMIREIDTEFTSPAYSGGNFVIQKIYLSNVPVDYHYFNTATPVTSAYNFKGALTGDLEMNETLTGNASYSKTHTFYVYPNTSSETPTRLVIYATLNGKGYYYPINLGNIKSNTVYDVSKVTVTRPGSDDEDSVIQGFDGSCTITVGAWDPDVEDITETI